MAVIAVFFTIAVYALSWLSSLVFPGNSTPMRIFDGLCLAVAFYYYILWENRPIRLRCGKCKKIILSNRPWVCGFCKQENRNGNEHPFVEKCGHCKDEPKSYRCHHNLPDGKPCKEIILLTEDEDKKNYAYSLNSPTKLPEPDEHTETIKDLQDKKEKKEAELDLARVEEDLIQIQRRNRMAKQKRKSIKRALQEDIKEVMEMEEAESELKAKYAEIYKNDDRMLKRMNLALKSSVERRKSEGM